MKKSNIIIKKDGKYDIKKKSKPWKKKPGIFDNVTLSDLKDGFRNRQDKAK